MPSNKRPRPKGTPEEIKKLPRTILEWTIPKKTISPRTSSEQFLTLTNSFQALSSEEKSSEMANSLDHGVNLLLQKMEELKGDLKREIKESREEIRHEVKEVKRVQEFLDQDLRRKNLWIFGYPFGDFPLTAKMSSEDKRQVIERFFREVLKVPVDDMATVEIDYIWFSSPYTHEKSGEPTYKVRVWFATMRSKEKVFKWEPSLKVYNKGRSIPVRLEHDRTPAQLERRKRRWEENRERRMDDDGAGSRYNSGRK